MGAEPSMKGQVPELIFISGRRVGMKNSMCNSRDTSMLFAKFRIIDAFSFLTGK